MQRSANKKKQTAFFTFLFGYPKFEIIFAPSFGKPMAYLRKEEAKTALGALAQNSQIPKTILTRIGHL